MTILHEESELLEIVRLVGVDALSFKDRLTLECARSIREDYLHQNAFDDIDTYSSLNKQYKMLDLILAWYAMGQDALTDNVRFDDIVGMPVREQIARIKGIAEDDVDERVHAIRAALRDEFEQLREGDQNDA